MALGPDTRIGAVRLTVADLARVQHFYERVVGLTEVRRDDGHVALGASGGPPLLELELRPDAPLRPPATTGLFHVAILVPDRAELGRALHRILATGHPLTGASDHLVSEALYLTDPEGNGIEIYRDRPRSEWSYDGGALQMATLPLDLERVLADGGGALRGDPSGPAPRGSEPPLEIGTGTRIGHVHLNVADLAATEGFYADILGLEVTVRGYPGALFFAAGGYHHHVGANIWAGAGASPPPPKARGLRWYELVVSEQGEVEELAEGLVAAAVEHERADGVLRFADPAANGVLVRSGA